MRAKSMVRGMRPVILATLAMAGALAAGQAAAVPPAEIYKRAQQEKPALIDTMKALVSIESGSKDIEGLDKIAGVIADRLRLLGGDVKLIDPSDHAYAWPTHPRRSARWCLRASRAKARATSC